MTSEAADDPVNGEARLKVDGGLAHFPGLAGERIVKFRDLPPAAVEELVRCADEACFFDQPEKQVASHPDARTYTVCLTIGSRTHETQVSEPIQNPGLAKLVSAIRQLTRHR